MERRDFLAKLGTGLAGIIAAGQAPAAVVKSLVGVTQTSYTCDKLPYDSELEYLGSNGNPFINTELLPNKITKWECLVSYSKYVKYGGLFGAYNTETTQDTRLILYSYDIGVGLATCGSRTSGSILQFNGFTKNVFHHIVAERISTVLYCYLDGIQVSKVHFVSGSQNDRYISLFRSGPNSSIADIGARIGSIKFWENDVLVRNFQPVRFKNELGENNGAMYESISNRLFCNAGTGTFEIGPDKR